MDPAPLFVTYMVEALLDCLAHHTLSQPLPFLGFNAVFPRFLSVEKFN
jgi:hypothetical protein